MNIKDRYLPTCLRIGGSAPPGLAPILGLEDQERGHDEGHLVLVQSLHQVAVIQTRAVISGYKVIRSRYVDIYGSTDLASPQLISVLSNLRQPRSTLKAVTQPSGHSL